MTADPLRRLLPTLLPVTLGLVAIVLVVSETSRPAAVLNMLRPWGEIGALAAMMTAIILTGGIDLSVGSIIALASVTFGLSWQGGWSPAVASGAALAVGLLAGAINGTLVVAGIAPLVATLATMAFYAGLALAVSRATRVSGLPEAFTALGQESWLGLPNQWVLFLIVWLAALVVVHHTRFGRYLYAIGENPLAAEFAAVPVRKVQWWLYTASGGVAALVALFYTARGGAAVPDAGAGLELQAIACVVVGGTRVTGGLGGLGRTLLGVVVMALLDVGLQFATPNAYARLLLVGLLVIGVAVWNERWSTATADA